MKRVNFSVRRNFPALRQSGNCAGGSWIEPGQSFKQTLNDPHFNLTGDDGRVERFRFAAVDDGDVGGRFATDAAGNQNANGEAKNKTRTRKKSAGASGNFHRVILPVRARLCLLSMAS